MQRCFRVSIVAAAAAFAAGGAAAADPEVMSRHEQWTVYAQDLEGDRVCFAATAPSDAAPASASHGDVSFIVATWASGAAREQPMLSVGYTLRLGASTSARVGSDRFRMFTDGSDAFVEDDADETRLVDAMRRGYSMRLETMSAEGTQTTYEFSLSGVTSALRAVSDACG